MYFITKYDSGNIYIEEKSKIDNTYEVLYRVKVPNNDGFAIGKVHNDVYIGWDNLAQSDSLEDLIEKATLLVL